MTVRTSRCFKTDSRLQADIETLHGLALDDLQNAFSCLKLSVTSPRREYLVDLSKGYQLACMQKLGQARLIAGLTEPTAVYNMHAEEVPSSETDPGAVVA